MGDSYQADLGAGDLLFQLCTNFLLYVALVLITYLVVKLYLESSPDHPLFQDDATHFSPMRVRDPMENKREVEMNNLPAWKKEEEDGLQGRRPSLIGFTDDTVLRGRSEMLRQLAFLAMGLNVTFVTWGVLQERILKMEYGEGELFTYSYGLVFTNRALGLLFSACLMFRSRPVWSTGMVYEYALPSVSNMLSSWCQYEALKYVTFPTQVLSKAFKLVPIMLMGKLLGNKSYPLYDYVVAGMVGCGITLFVSSAEGVCINLGTDSFGQTGPQGGTGCGIMLLALYLLFDSFTSQWQSRMFDKHKELSPPQLMMLMNMFSTIFSLVTLVHANELVPFFQFVGEHPEIHFHFIVFSICSTLGQLLIFQTIRSFGAVVFAIIMTVRIALSILCSSLIYHHPVTELGTVGLLIVFGSVTYRIHRRIQGTRLAAWETMAYEKTSSVFKEWHEHLDT
ncbi:unnamed protein product [Chrysoparadoxa australica]